MVAAISATLSGDSFWLFGSAEVCAWQPVSKRKVHRGNKVFIIVGISLYIPVYAWKGWRFYCLSFGRITAQFGCDLLRLFEFSYIYISY